MVSRIDHLPKISSSTVGADTDSESSFHKSLEAALLVVDFLSCSFRFKAICSLSDSALGDDGVGDGGAAFSPVGVFERTVEVVEVLSFGVDVLVFNVGVAEVRALRVVRALLEPAVELAAAEGFPRGVAEVVRGRGTLDEDINIRCSVKVRNDFGQVAGSAKAPSRPPGSTIPINKLDYFSEDTIDSFYRRSELEAPLT